MFHESSVSLKVFIGGKEKLPDEKTPPKRGEKGVTTKNNHIKEPGLCSVR